MKRQFAKTVPSDGAISHSTKPASGQAAGYPQPSPLAYLKPGDYLILVSGCLLTVFLALTLWQGGAADKAIIRSGGKIFSEVTLSRDQLIAVPGPLGISRISIHNRQARIAADPSPRQYCVRQGWLKQAGEIAVCLPNQVSVELSGRKKNYDSLNY